MTKENLQKAIDLRKTIQLKKEHLAVVENGRGPNEILMFEPSTSNTSYKLDKKYCPMSPNIFMDFYISSLKKDIDALEKEFDSI